MSCYSECYPSISLTYLKQLKENIIGTVEMFKYWQQIEHNLYIPSLNTFICLVSMWNNESKLLEFTTDDDDQK